MTGQTNQTINQLTDSKTQVAPSGDQKQKKFHRGRTDLTLHPYRNKTLLPCHVSKLRNFELPGGWIHFNCSRLRRSHTRNHCRCHNWNGPALAGFTPEISQVWRHDLTNLTKLTLCYKLSESAFQSELQILKDLRAYLSSQLVRQPYTVIVGDENCSLSTPTGYEPTHKEMFT